MAQIYTTSADDTLWSIAQKLYGDGTLWHMIYDANKNVIGEDPGRIEAGQPLSIPEAGGPAPVRPSGGGRNYITQQNDTLWDIARQFYHDGAFWTVIYNANKPAIGSDPAVLKTGLALTIPDLSAWQPPPNYNIYEPGNPWTITGTTITDSPSALFYSGTGNYHVFARSTRGTLVQNFGSRWEDFGAPAAGVTGSPGSVMRAPGTIHVAMRGGDTHMYQRYWDGRGWSGWENRGGDLASGPGLASWSPGRLDCFAQGMFKNLIHCWWDLRSGWSQWEDLSPRLPDARFDIQFAPGAVSWGENRLDVFAVRAGDSALLHSWWDGAWHGWESLGGVLTEAPSVIARGRGLLDCFGRGSDGQVYHKFYDGRRWSNWYGLRRYSASAPAAAMGGYGLAIFARGNGGELMQIA